MKQRQQTDGVAESSTERLRSRSGTRDETLPVTVSRSGQPQPEARALNTSVTSVFVVAEVFPVAPQKNRRLD